MKYLICFFILFISCDNESKNKKDVKKQPQESKAKVSNIDSLKASQSKAVIKAKLLKSEGGNKYYYSRLDVLEVLVNKTSYNFNDSIRVAYYNWGAGIPPNKECTVYLTPWPQGSTTLSEKGEWMLLEGNGEYACECNK